MSALISDGTYALNTVQNVYNLNTTAPLTGDGSTAQPLGIAQSAQYNETVLWSGSATSGYYNLSEAFTNFNKIEITLGCAYGTNRSLHPDQRVDTQYLSAYSGMLVCKVLKTVLQRLIKKIQLRFIK